MENEIINGEKLPKNHIGICAYDLEQAVFKWMDPINPVMICSSHRNELYKIGRYDFMNDRCDDCKTYIKLPFRPFCQDCEIEYIMDHDTWCNKCAKNKCINVKLFIDLGYLDHEYGEEIKSNLWNNVKENEKNIACDICGTFNLGMSMNNICMDCAHNQSKCDSCGMLCYRDAGGVYKKCRECLLKEFGMCEMTDCRNPCEDLSNGPVMIINNEMPEPNLKMCVDHRLSNAGQSLNV